MLTLRPSLRHRGWPWANFVGLVECAEYLGLVSRGRRPGTRLWELIRSGKLKSLPHVRLGRSYRFNPNDVDAWVKRQAANGPTRLR